MKLEFLALPFVVIAARSAVQPPSGPQARADRKPRRNFLINRRQDTRRAACSAAEHAPHANNESTVQPTSELRAQESHAPPARKAQLQPACANDASTGAHDLASISVPPSEATDLKVGSWTVAVAFLTFFEL